MRNYIAVVFDDSSKAYEALHALWQLDDDLEVTVHGTAVVHRDDLGQFQVDTKETHPVLGTAAGVAIGALLGALAGPAGAAVGAAKGAAVGAASGGVLGLGADAVRADTRAQAAEETAFVLGIGQSAVIADVSEDSTDAIDARMRELGGIVYRRARSDVTDDAYTWWDYYLYPYDYTLYYRYPYEYAMLASYP